jgi:hypothetical protein
MVYYYDKWIHCKIKTNIVLQTKSHVLDVLVRKYLAYDNGNNSRKCAGRSMINVILHSSVCPHERCATFIDNYAHKQNEMKITKVSLTDIFSPWNFPYS